MLSSIRFERTPAADAFIAAVQAGQWQAALHFTEEHWAEIWFSIDPADLRQLLSQAPPEFISQSANAAFMARSTGHGELEDLLQSEPSAGDVTDLGAMGRFLSDQRLRGRPGRAMTQVHRAQHLMRAQRGLLMDGTGGFGALALVQGAITALLANEPDSAQGMLLEATNTHRADRFPFVIREAKAKLALTYAAGGALGEAATWAQRARQIQRTGSWVEDLIDDSLWLTDYLCAIDALDPRAEDLRQDKPSPLQHREFWPLALAAHVRHLTITNRHWQARELCAAISAAGLPQPDSDGAFATALSDALLVIDGHQNQDRASRNTVPRSAQSVVSRAQHLLQTGQFHSVLAITNYDLPRTYDARYSQILRLLRAQASSAIQSGSDGRHEVIKTVGEILQSRLLTTLHYLTPATLEQIGDTDVGARAANLVQTHQVPTITSAKLLQSPLSKAEIQALRLLQEGMSRKQIAQRLFVSVNTVKSQLASAYRKLGASDRAQALRSFTALGL